MKYPYIRAWGARLGSKKYYIDGEVENAEIESAPANAIYKSGEKGWRTIDDVTNEEVKQFCIDWVAKNNKK